MDHQPLFQCAKCSQGRERNELRLVLYLGRLWLISHVVLLCCERGEREKPKDENREVINQLCCEWAANVASWGGGHGRQPLTSHRSIRIISHDKEILNACMLLVTVIFDLVSKLRSLPKLMTVTSNFVKIQSWSCMKFLVGLSLTMLSCSRGAGSGNLTLIMCITFPVVTETETAFTVDAVTLWHKCNAKHGLKLWQCTTPCCQNNISNSTCFQYE